MGGCLGKFYGVYPEKGVGLLQKVFDFPQKVLEYSLNGLGEECQTRKSETIVRRSFLSLTNTSFP
jgi:hypothetical protein